jgi:hypothetical protein
MLTPAEMMAYAFAVLKVACDLFPSKKTLDRAVPEAYDQAGYRSAYRAM